MSTEFRNQILDENVHWTAGKVEKIGAGVSVVFMGAAYFFPEARTILASASVITVGIDLAIMGMKAEAMGIINQVSREHNHEVRIYQAGKTARRNGAEIDIDGIEWHMSHNVIDTSASLDVISF